VKVKGKSRITVQYASATGLGDMGSPTPMHVFLTEAASTDSASGGKLQFSC
jgi:hypothetical protein